MRYVITMTVRNSIPSNHVVTYFNHTNIYKDALLSNSTLHVVCKEKTYIHFTL